MSVDKVYTVRYTFRSIFWYGVKRTLYLVFFSSTRSFYALAPVNVEGTWQHSYSQHQDHQKRVRKTFSLSTVVVVIVAVVASNYILSFVF